MKKTIIHFLPWAVSAVALFLAFFPGSRSGTENEAVTGGEPEVSQSTSGATERKKALQLAATRRSAALATAGHAFAAEDTTVYDGAGHLSGTSFMEAFYVEDGVHLIVRHYEYEGGATIYNEYEYSSAFPFDAICARGPGEYYVAGVDSAGNTVIESWTIAPHSGGHHAQRDLATTGIGVPIPNSTVTHMIPGGQLAPMATRQRNPRLSRTTIYQGTTLAPVQVMNVDPEGRFLILNTVLGELFQVELIPIDAPALLFDMSSGLGVDLTAVTGLTRYHHVNDWRVWMFSTHEELHVGSSQGPPWALLVDHDNDGDLLEQSPVVLDSKTIVEDWVAPHLVEGFVKGP